MTRRMLIHLSWLLPVAVFLIILGSVTIWFANASIGTLPDYGGLVEFKMVDQDGQVFTDEDLTGKISVVYFMFTRCRAVCPTTSRHMAQLYETFGESDMVQLVGVNVDPTHDTPDVLKTYADSIGITTDNWKFLHAPLEEVSRVMEEGFMVGGDDLPGAHSSRFVLLDTEGHIRGYYDGMDSEEIPVIKEHIAMLARQAR